MAIFTVMCVQPLEISVEAFKVISKAKVAESNYQIPSIRWIREFKKVHRRSKHFNSLLSKPEICSKYLRVDFSDPKYFVFGQYDLSRFLVKDSAKFDLIYDERVSAISIVTEFCFDIEEKFFEQLFSDTDYDDDRHNFYNAIRNVLVQEEDDSEIGTWMKEVRQHCLSVVSKLLYGGKVTEDNRPKFLNNTGNITVQVNGISLENKAKYRAMITHANQMAERVQDNASTLLSNEEVEFVFHGRFHTILSSDQEYYERFFPIQYHAQFMWHAVSSFKTVMDELNRDRLMGRFTNGGEIQLIDSYINKFELVRIHNQDMKMYFESDNELVFKGIEVKWTIKETLDEVNNYISSFKEYIERSYQRKVENANRRQNKILFIISCIQMLGLVSIWVDYLSLAKVESFVDSTGFVRGSEKDLLLAFNTWFPILLLASMFFVVYRVLFKKE
ncbi:hypothetical protein [Vibrio sp. LaRot3]|uniref:hypothetical protein n=1 Tax=Vibrio sp. LaRot3 TaxID=2998829 RepID=UPI0022CDD6D9|nr:hypothetical protein [Vibrio sp. LaRot3]MDA0150407.1 hypothetical protein [Vibrio sp. LaRot3]